MVTAHRPVCRGWARHVGWLLGLALVTLTGWAQAGALRFCDQQPKLSPAQQDRLFRFGAILKSELEGSGERVALVARSGLDLGRFGVRYSHAGVTLQASPNAPWSVRQLYFSCDEHQPRLYDQGLSGFVLGGNDPDHGHVSVLLLPPSQAAALEPLALDNAVALQLLGHSYSANAYPFSPLHQNCNQWLVELLATAWGLPAPRPTEALALRSQAQQWLRAQGYRPTVFEAGNPLLMWAGLLVPWLHNDDHPPEDLAQARYRVSMPAAIEAFVRDTVPGVRRIELCHNARHVVVHHGWGSLSDGCEPGEQDTVIPFD